MNDNKMGNIIWHALIKYILHVFIEKSHSKFPSHLLKSDRSIGIEDGKVFQTTLIKLPKNWLIFIGDNVY